MTSQHRDLEEVLSERLHEVDALQPPGPDFELRALRAGRERLRRRQTLTRGALAAAAAVAVGALTVPSLVRTTGGASSTSAGGSAVAQATQTPGADLKANPPNAPEQAPGGADNGASTGSAAVDRLRTELSAAYPDTFTALRLEAGPPPTVVLWMTAEAPEALAKVRAGVPPGTGVRFSRSAYSAQACDSLLRRIAADRETLTAQGYAVGSMSCGDDGRVLLPVTTTPGGRQPSTLADRYGDGVSVVQQGASR